MAPVESRRYTVSCFTLGIGIRDGTVGDRCAAAVDSRRAVVGNDSFTRGGKPMVFSIGLSIAALGMLCILLYNLAVYALPVLVGIAAGILAHEIGLGVIGGILAGFFVAGLVFAIGHAIFTSSRSLAIRLAIALLFAVPAAVGGYQIVFQILELGNMATVWRHVFATAGALVVGGAAITRLAVPLPAEPDRQFADQRYPSPRRDHREVMTQSGSS